MNHTPTPWVCEDTYISGQTPGCRPNGEIIGEFKVMVDRMYPLDQANAAFAVLAVNAHEKLVEALKGAFHKSVEPYGPTCPSCHLEIRDPEKVKGHSSGCIVGDALAMASPNQQKVKK